MLVTRYMTADKGARIVAHTFSAPTAELIHPTTIGCATLATRDEPADVWEAPRVLADEITYGVWVAAIEPDGFVHEERS